jgi:hypothetical protein
MVVNLMNVIDGVSDDLPTSFPRFQKLILGKGINSEMSFLKAMK